MFGKLDRLCGQNLQHSTVLDRVYGHRSCNLVENFVFCFGLSRLCTRSNQASAFCQIWRCRCVFLLSLSHISVRLKHHLANYSIIPRLYNRANRHAWGWRPRNPWWHWYLQRTRVDRHRETRMHWLTELREICTGSCQGSPWQCYWEDTFTKSWCTGGRLCGLGATSYIVRNYLNEAVRPVQLEDYGSVVSDKFDHWRMGQTHCNLPWSFSKSEHLVETQVLRRNEGRFCGVISFTLVVAGLDVRIWGFLLSRLVLSANRS